ncbi:hypothetical protein MOQ72_34115 [Saccharopolyspora sp. K220]|uniref:hypothetical protein n=1 Tax=Saccharopolyspora soli TaxID=2926618 RepID=UPI001F5916E8|nr:hypothetical protein [Saccharopolyspora soli]MCI2422475.1 hypothetical protein [Saccharopolyspora soli]
MTVPVPTRPCFVCQNSSTVDVDVDGFIRWQSGALVQDAFPDMAPQQRELLMTGTHPECWKAAFLADDED